MTTRFRFVSLTLLVVLFASTLVPIARADEWNKATLVTFKRAVEVPGQVLPPGTYLFKLVDDPADRHIVQIFTQDQTKLLATILAVPDYRLEPTEKTVISFDERPSGQPEAVGSWFYPGDNRGFKFVYPNSRMSLASSQPASPAVQAAEATAPSVAPAPEPVIPATEPSVVEEQQRQIVAQNTAVRESDPASLPKTAGNFWALPLAGFALLGLGSAMLRNARQQY
jgi:hypothetical protein